MQLDLTTPYNPGMNDPGKTYPTLYITQMTDNRTANNFQFIFEAGQFVSSTDSEGNTSTVWQKGAGMLSQMAMVSGTDYAAAIKAPALNTTDSAYQSIIRILYQKLINAGFAGNITGT